MSLMVKLDQNTARALVDAGYMPLSCHVEMFSDTAPHAHGRSEAPIAPEIKRYHEPAVGDWHAKKAD